MRLDKFLCDTQVGSRSLCKELIKKGQITVNGAVVRKPEFQVDAENDAVACLGSPLPYQRLHYYMFHKPAGVVTATKDSHDRTVMDLFWEAQGEKALPKDLFPAGRLDKDAEGLLLITNDGMLAHNLLSPKKHIEKTYYVECGGSITPEKLSLLASGVDIGDGKPTLPAKVNLLSDHFTGDENGYALELTITEGRFHQVKRMIAAVGGSVSYLKRLSMGSLELGALPKGQSRALTDREVETLKGFVSDRK